MIALLASADLAGVFPPPRWEPGWLLRRLGMGFVCMFAAGTGGNQRQQRVLSQTSLRAKMATDPNKHLVGWGGILYAGLGNGVGRAGVGKGGGGGG